ncbi:hypothetical protein PC1_3085 [Pectobacterium carotovorum subsp. carotovorum PC1]|uniref:Uncharacterized protein n=1 Tax=Pectobacterium carotovorum subsp. carotovorum (strain PC1) TaxID=561230 RepID=C6DC14_PECCP|nr:hypothetical protein PC1_3085 [Pectobacterium carotovorum subsp. carotovorum PC1]
MTRPLALHFRVNVDDIVLLAKKMQQITLGGFISERYHFAEVVGRAG